MFERTIFVSHWSKARSTSSDFLHFGDVLDLSKVGKHCCDMCPEWCHSSVMLQWLDIFHFCVFSLVVFCNVGDSLCNLVALLIYAKSMINDFLFDEVDQILNHVGKRLVVTCACWFEHNTLWDKLSLVTTILFPYHRCYDSIGFLF